MPRTCLFTCLALALLVAAAPADAKVTRKKAIWGPLEQNGVSQFPIYAELGVGIYQMTIKWDQIAPTRPDKPRSPSDPAYVWPAVVDRAIAEASPYKIKVLLNITGAPRWANGGRDPIWAPTNPRHFGNFAEAASRRYPRVRHWMIWSEPSKALNFQPLKSDKGKPLRGSGLKGPHRYARILDSAYGRLKRVSRRNIVIGGNTFTVGTVAPLHFIRALRMPKKRTRGRPPRMDLWGHNPFSRREPKLSGSPLGNGNADFADLDTLMDHLDFYQRQRKNKKLKVFISEYALPTDHPNWVFNFWVSREQQAEWIAMAIRSVRRNRRLYSFGYFSLIDPQPRPSNDQADWGLIEWGGERKPAYAAYRDN